MCFKLNSSRLRLCFLKHHKKASNSKTQLSPSFTSHILSEILILIGVELMNSSILQEYHLKEGTFHLTIYCAFILNIKDLYCNLFLKSTLKTFREVQLNLIWPMVLSFFSFLQLVFKTVKVFHN